MGTLQPEPVPWTELHEAYLLPPFLHMSAARVSMPGTLIRENQVLTQD